jgi:hypothetical protein
MKEVWDEVFVPFFSVTLLCYSLYVGLRWLVSL